MTFQILAYIMQQEQTNPLVPAYNESVAIWRQVSEALHLSFYRVLSLLVAVLPGILACIVSVLVFALIGIAVSAFLRWFLKLIEFDERVARSGANANWTPSTSPTALTSRIAFWVFVLLGMLIGISAFDASYSAYSTRTFELLPYVTHIVSAIVIFIVGSLFARFLARSVLIGAVNAQLQYARFLSLGVKWLVLVLTAAMALEHLEVGGAIVDLAFGILFGGIVLTLALAVGLGSREIVSRSIENQLERDRTPAPPPDQADSIRHF